MWVTGFSINLGASQFLLSVYVLFLEKKLEFER